MIDNELLNRIRHSTCAIGYITVPYERFVADAKQPFFKVIGTGFLVAINRVMTNRHVIQGLIDEQADYGFPDDQRVLMFVHPTKPGRWQIHIAGIQEMGFVRNTDVDVGIISFKKPDAESFDLVKPLEFQNQMKFGITEPVILCGYPFGHAMLQKDGKVYRWGPVVQQGHISAISPFENTNRPNELLIDIRIAPGMSGAAVVRPTDGTIIGIVHSAWETITAIALPMDSDMLGRLLQSHNAHSKSAA